MVLGLSTETRVPKMKNKSAIRGMLTSPIQDDQKNMTEIIEHDQKIHSDEH